MEDTIRIAMICDSEETGEHNLCWNLGTLEEAEDFGRFLHYNSEAAEGDLKMVCTSITKERWAEIEKRGEEEA